MTADTGRTVTVDLSDPDLGRYDPARIGRPNPADTEPSPALGTPEQRARWELAGAGYGIHWPKLDEHRSGEGLLAGVRAPRGSALWRSSLLGSNWEMGRAPHHLRPRSATFL